LESTTARGLDKSVQGTVGPAAGWQMNVKFVLRDSVVQVNQSGRAANRERQNCQLVCDPLLDRQPMQLVQ